MKFIKRLFGKKFDVKDFENIAIANEQFILHSFQIQLEKIQGMNEEEFFNNTDELKSKVLEKIIPYGLGLGEVSKNITTKGEFEKTDMAIIYVRFPNNKKEQKLEIKQKTDLRPYEFSPIQSFKVQEVMRNIEYGLVTHFSLEQNTDNLINFTLNKKGEPIVTNTDLIQFMEYPLEKRFQLYVEASILEKKVFDWEFKDFINWILEKELESELMRKYCDKVKRLIKKYNIEF